MCTAATSSLSKKKTLQPEITEWGLETFESLNTHLLTAT